MCGIVGYIGGRDAYGILIKGLERLEYRGYDSAGVAIFSDGDFSVYKKKGKVQELKNLVKAKSAKDPSGIAGIAHTRWATHGAPSDKNAHPQLSNSGTVALVHNGIIENYSSIKERLIKKGYKFSSDTDTEVLANLIEDIQNNKKNKKAGQSLGIDEAVRMALNEVTGAYAILVVSKNEPDVMVVAKTGSPAVIGIGKDEYFVASDATPIVEYTDKVVYLEDGQMAVIRKNAAKEKEKLVVKTSSNKIVAPKIHRLDMKSGELDKGGFPHFMLKEIFEQPRSISDSIGERIGKRGLLLNMGKYGQKLSSAKRIIILACGTSWHAGLLARYFFEELARVPVVVEYASEFRYRNPVIGKGDVVIAISQSGETADTLAAIKLAKEKGAVIFSICNVVGSSIARESHMPIYTHAGPEIGVASTKAFTAQAAVLMLACLFICEQKDTLSAKAIKDILLELAAVPEKVEQALLLDSEIKKLANKFKDSESFIYLGRGYGFPLALEGALKLKEISYIHAEGYPSGEMKHGPIALVDKNMPVLFITHQGSQYEKVVSSMMEVKAREGIVIAIVTEGDEHAKKIADFSIEIPKTSELMIPFTVTIPLQLLSYHIARLRGAEIDKPRNLAKSVTVE